jgi:hypothetical protein
MVRAISDAERFKLYHGPYMAPKCRVGGTLFCAYRSKRLKVGGLTDTPIIWPYARHTGPLSMIVCGDLVRAVQTESVLAVAHHWGVARETVWKWRRALGVPMWNEGSLRLHRITQPERYDIQALERARKRSQTPKARAKMSAARKGRPPHPHLRAAATAAARRPKSESFKRQLSLRLRREWQQGLRRGHPPGRPWTDAEIARLGTDTDPEIARELERTPGAVQKMRLRLGIPIYAGPAR